MKVSQESWKLMKDKLLFCFIDILILVFDMFLLIKFSLHCLYFVRFCLNRNPNFKQNSFSFISEIFWLNNLKLLSEKSGSVKMLSLLKKEDVFTCERTVLAKIKQCLEKVINSQERKHSEHYLRIRR